MQELQICNISRIRSVIKVIYTSLHGKIRFKSGITTGGLGVIKRVNCNNYGFIDDLQDKVEQMRNIFVNLEKYIK